MLSLIITLILLACSTLAYGQETKGIFDIQNATKATSRVVFTEADGFGESFYYTEKLPNGKLKVRYTYDKPSVPNPLFITYTYEIEKLPSGDLAMDMQGAMSPLSMYNDTTAAILTYTGDKIIFPNLPANVLPDSKGLFQLKIIETDHLLLSYQVLLSNRKMVKGKEIELNGKTYEVYIHSYDYLQKTIINGDEVLATIQEQVIEWLIPNYGQVLQNRTGTQITTTTTHQLTTESKLQSTLLQLKN